MTADEMSEPAVSRHRVLLIEDDQTLADLLARILRSTNCRVDVIDAAEDLPTPAELVQYDVVLADVHLAGVLTGFDVLQTVREHAEGVPVVLMTAMADVEGVMKAMGEGAHDYLPKPINPNELRVKIRDAIERRQFAKSNTTAHDPASTRDTKATIVGATPAMIEVYKTVAQVARTAATVLITGESGSGKELVARRIHDSSPRAKNPFVAVNCAALPESLLESELFGHERGSFTGAGAQKRGLFEEASGGTLFLDEIGEISPKMQAQLLRVLQESEVRRVGGSEPIRVDSRVVAATNRDLRQELAAGRFRQDLFFRLQVVTIHVPALRERRADIPLLVHHLVARHAERMKIPTPRISQEAVDELTRHDYPGNVRELSHIIERALLLARDGVITPTDVAHQSPQGLAQAEAIDISDWPAASVVTRRYIERVLAQTDGNKTRAAQILGLDRRTLSRMFTREGREVASEDEVDAEAARPDEPDDDP